MPDPEWDAAAALTALSGLLAEAATALRDAATRTGDGPGDHYRTLAQRIERAFTAHDRADPFIGVVRAAVQWHLARSLGEATALDQARQTLHGAVHEALRAWADEAPPPKS
jgi:hypothetical protein